MNYRVDNSNPLSLTYLFSLSLLIQRVFHSGPKTLLVMYQARRWKVSLKHQNVIFSCLLMLTKKKFTVFITSENTPLVYDCRKHCLRLFFTVSHIIMGIDENTHYITHYFEFDKSRKHTNFQVRKNTYILIYANILISVIPNIKNISTYTSRN